MSRSEEDKWRDVLAEQRRGDAIRDAVAKELARAYDPVLKEPMPTEMMRVLDAQRLADRDGG